MPSPANNSPLATAALSASLKQAARTLGFAACQIVAPRAATHADFFDAWVQAGRAGEMRYLERNREKRRFPTLLDETGATDYKSMLVLATPYHPYDLPTGLRDDPARGIIASYAWGEDYHDLIRGRLFLLDAHLRALSGRATQGKALVDSGPVLERDWAHDSGIGFMGKNCCIIRPGAGSWLFLATLLVPEELAFDHAPQPLQSLPPEIVLAGLDDAANYGVWHPSPTDDTIDLSRTGTCGACTRCLDACPTDAFVGPFHLDPQRCISYWTIETRTPIPRALRRNFGNRIFGCDICQEVCPWNQRLPDDRLPDGSKIDERFSASIDRAAPPLLEGFAPDTPYWIEDTAFAQRFRGSPVKRAKRAGMLRNVCVALGNWGALAALPALQRALADPAPEARGHAAWALGELVRLHAHTNAHTDTRATLQITLATEADGWVREEIHLALAGNPA